MTSGRPGSCSLESLRLSEPLPGTASTVRGYLLVEHGGPWTRKALEGTVLEQPSPEAAGPDLGALLLAALAPHEVTPLLVRRHGAPPGLPQRPFVALVSLHPDGGHGVGTRVDDLSALRAWDLGALLTAVQQGSVPEGFERLRAQYLVCTHGRRDVCCAELGRPLAAVLSGLAPEQTWECSHLGGHRVAANALVLPEGVVYGRLQPDDALDLVAAHAEGRLLVDHLRGRAALSPPVQVAEVALREATTDRADGARLLESAADGDRTRSLWQVADRTWRVVVDSADGVGEPRPASCGAEPTPAPVVHTVVEVTDVEAAGRGADGWDEAHGAAPADAPPNDLVVETVAPLPAGRALDVACGLGRHSLWLSDQGWDVTGVDFSRAGLDRARAASRERGVTVDWQLADARTWEPAEPYDLVLMAFVHLPAVLERATTWVRPGGRLVLVGHALRNLTGGVGGPSDPRLLHDPAGLRRVAERAGLVVERCEEVERPTEQGTAVDAVLVASRRH